MTIKELIGTVKDSIEIIKTIAIVGLFISSFFGIKTCQRAKDNFKAAEAIITSKERQFTNVLGEKASEVAVWSSRYNQLKKVHENTKSVKSEIELKYAKAYKEIELYKRKDKDLRSYTSFQLNAKDTIFLPMVADCDKIPPIETKHLKASFIYDELDKMKGFYYNYQTDINTLVTLYPKKKENGKKHFPNWGWLWGWDKVSITTVEDKNASINNQVSIEFKK
jgi:hypothetical protein